MSLIPESSIAGQKWRVSCCEFIDATEHEIAGYVAVTNFENTIEISSKWIKSKRYSNSIDDNGTWGEVVLDCETFRLASCIDGGELEESCLIDGYGEFVDGINEFFHIIEGSNWRRMIPTLNRNSFKSNIKRVIVNLKKDGDADIAHFIKNLPDFTNWVKKHVLEEMYP